MERIEAFLLHKGCIFKYFELHLDLDSTFEKYFGRWLDLDWVFKIRYWIRIAKYDSLLISAPDQEVRDVRNVKFFSPSPILMCENWIRSSPVGKIFENHWSDPVLIRPSKPYILFCLMRQNRHRFLTFAKFNMAMFNLLSNAKALLFCHLAKPETNTSTMYALPWVIHTQYMESGQKVDAVRIAK